MSNDFICPYCKEKAPIHPYSVGGHMCHNHGDVFIFFYGYGKEEEMGCTQLFIAKNILTIRYDLNEMYLGSRFNHKYITLPIDYELKPENLEKKIKTYLTFQ